MDSVYLIVKEHSGWVLLCAVIIILASITAIHSVIHRVIEYKAACKGIKLPEKPPCDIQIF